MPVTTTAVERLADSGWYAQHPNDRVAYDQLAAVEPWPWAPELFRIERDVVEPRLEEAVLTGRDAGQVMAEARAEATRPG
jgi:sn-glycerol 3-phosphate transport system substrate-binding protein